MKVIWSPEAVVSYEKTIVFILDHWTVDVALRLEDDVNVLINNLEEYQYFCPLSRKDKKIRRCVISKQTSLLYEVNKTHLDLIAFFDNRTNHQH